jgi:copper chaperone NosL
MKVLFCSFLLFVTLVLPAQAGTAEPIEPDPQDKCPVCGMFTARYPDSFSHIIFSDDSYLTFDGPKDMFKYYSKLKKKDPEKVNNGIDSIYTKDYYSLKNIDAQTAYFVLGSDVYGPMGKEVIPFSKLEDAKVFKKDHKGSEIMKFGEVTEALLKKME